MSYGQPCRRITAVPLAGPASTYPTFKSPASICLTGPNEVLDALCTLDCASARPLTPNKKAAMVVMAAKMELREKHRQLFLITLVLTSLIASDILFPPIELKFDRYLLSSGCL